MIPAFEAVLLVIESNISVNDVAHCSHNCILESVSSWVVGNYSAVWESSELFSTYIKCDRVPTSFRREL
jgi:hypothetical protein